MYRLPLVSLVTAITLVLGLTGCGDDGPTNTAALGTAANPEPVTVGSPLTASLAPGDPYYLSFETSSSGDYMPSVLADQPMAWILYLPAGAANKVPGDWTVIGSCGEIRKVDGITCIMTGLDAGTKYVIELFNQGSAQATYTLTVTQGLGVGSIADPVAWVGSIVDCTDTFEGRVGTRYSYFKVTDLSSPRATGSYLFGSLSGDVDFTVYADPDFSALLGTSAPTSNYEDIVIPFPESGVFYLRADGSKTEVGSTFSFECD